MIRWPGKAPAGKVENSIVSGLDWFPPPRRRPMQKGGSFNLEAVKAQFERAIAMQKQ